MNLISDNDRVGRDEDRVRAAALASSIAIFLGDMTLFELQLVDAFVMKLRNDRDDWARHEGDPWWHRVVDYKNGSVITVCHGRWPINDPYETEARPALADRCGGCVNPRVAAVDTRVRDALVHFAQIAPDPLPLFQFDMLDTCGEP